MFPKSRVKQRSRAVSCDDLIARTTNLLMRAAKMHTVARQIHARRLVSTQWNGGSTHATLGRLLAERAAIYNSFKRSKSVDPGANCHGENTPALICRSTHHQLLGKLCGYAAARLVHASCFSMSSKVVFPVSGDEISSHRFRSFSARNSSPRRVRIRGWKYITAESSFSSLFFACEHTADFYKIQW